MVCFFIRFKPYNRNAHSFRLEYLQKEVTRPRRIRVEIFKNGVGGSVCKKVYSIMWLSKGTRSGMY
jgi:hypothetical protein